MSVFPPPSGSVRSERMTDSPIRRLSKYAQATKDKKISVFHLNIGQPDIPTHPSFLDAVASAHPSVISYTESEGRADLRQAVADYYNTYFHTSLGTEHILTTCGSSEAFFFSLFASMDKGDEIIIPDPCYTNYIGYAYISDVTINPVSAGSHLDNGFRLPKIEAFIERISEKTKAILICNPNNPTGYVYSAEELAAIAKLCEKYNLFLIIDEAYRELTYSARASSALSLLSHIKDRLIVLDTVSKKYSACGARIGFAISYNEDIIKRMLKLAHMRLAPPLLAQIGAKALFELPSSYYDEVRAIYKKRRDTFVRCLSALEGVFSYTPDGAFYVCCRLPVEDAAHFCEWMLREFSYEGATVMMTPLSGFYLDPSKGKNEIRLSYTLKEEDLVSAAQCIEKGLQAYQKR